MLAEKYFVSLHCVNLDLICLPWMRNWTLFNHYIIFVDFWRIILTLNPLFLERENRWMWNLIAFSCWKVYFHVVIQASVPSYLVQPHGKGCLEKLFRCMLRHLDSKHIVFLLDLEDNHSQVNTKEFGWRIKNIDTTNIALPNHWTFVFSPKK